MSDWPVGISTGCFYFMNFFDCLDPILQGGFSMIEVASSKTHLDYHDTASMKKAARVLAERGIEAYSFHAPFREDIDVTSLEEAERVHARHEILAAADAAAILGVRYFVFHPGPEKSYHPPPEERIRRMNHAADIINAVSEHCHKLGIRLVVENMLPHLFFGNMRDMLWIIGAIQSTRVGTCLDTGHAFIAGQLHRILYKMSGYLQYIHANDNLGKDDMHLCPGQGQIDWHKLLHQLNEVDFRGAFMLELMGDQQKSPQTVMDEARQARCFLRNICRQLTVGNPPAVPRAGPEAT